MANFAIFCKFLAGSFSAVSKRNFARKYAFESIFLLSKKKKKTNGEEKCLLVSSDATHPSGSIPAINLAEVERRAEYVHDAWWRSANAE